MDAVRLSRLPALLRALLLLALAVSAAAAALWRRDAGERTAGTVWLAAGEVIPDSVLLGGGSAVVRQSLSPPSAAELDALAAAARAMPLFAALPSSPTTIDPLPPERPRAGRAAALHVRVSGVPGSAVALRLGEGAAAMDSATIELDAAGTAVAGFALRPAREGWHAWWVDADGERTAVGAWVREAAPPRVLLVTGELGWEGAFVGRSLEEAGARVERIQPLGSGLGVHDGTSALPSSAAGLAAFDALVLVGDQQLSAAQAAALEAYVAGGGGLVLAGRAAPAPHFVPGFAAARAVPAAEIGWRLPVELPPLPAVDLVVVGTPLDSPAAAAQIDGAALLSLGGYGRGRFAVLGLRETWRWRMEAGAVEEHRAFWRDLVDWAATGAREEAVIRTPATHGATGAAVEVEVLRAEAAPAGGAAASLRLTRPDGGSEAISLVADPTTSGALRGRFIPDRAGLYRLETDGAAAAGYQASDQAAAGGGWARLALLADASGGAAVPVGELRPLVREHEGSMPAPGRELPWAAIAFGGVLGLAAAEWALRRMRGEA